MSTFIIDEIWSSHSPEYICRLRPFVYVTVYSGKVTSRLDMKAIYLFEYHLPNYML